MTNTVCTYCMKTFAGATGNIQHNCVCRLRLWSVMSQIKLNHQHNNEQCVDQCVVLWEYKRRPSTEPWGTSLTTVSQFGLSTLTFTCWALSQRKLENHTTAWPHKSQVLILSNYGIKCFVQSCTNASLKLQQYAAMLMANRRFLEAGPNYKTHQRI